MPSIDEVFGAPNKYKGLDVYGLELEIEDQGAVLENGFKCKGWKSVPDGSLRNNGTEYITVPPLPLKEVSGAVERLFSVINVTSERCYSDRTSIHVHCNMQGLEVDNLKSLCLLYLVTEKLFFDFVAKERFDNVFCVPLMDFTAPFNLFQALSGGRLSHVWTKYSALNLLPLSELGTVEFRHMHGTNDIKKLVTWVAAIDCLKQACKAKSFEEWRKQISGLNTSSEYGTFLMEVFGSVEDSFLLNKTFDYYKEALYTNVMRAKLWELHEKQAPTKKMAIQVPTWGIPDAVVEAHELVVEQNEMAERRRETGNWSYMQTTLSAGGRGVDVVRREATEQQRAILDIWHRQGVRIIPAFISLVGEHILRYGFDTLATISTDPATLRQLTQREIPTRPIPRRRPVPPQATLGTEF